MSAGAIHREASAALAALGPTPETASDYSVILEQARPYLPFLCEAAWEANPDADIARRRAAGAYLINAAANIADDLADGDAGYLETPLRLVPGAQWVLQQTGNGLVMASGLSPDAFARACALLGRAGVWAQVENRAPVWTEAFYRAYAHDVAGLQAAGMLLLLWGDTPLESRCLPLGLAVGVLSLMAEDIAESKPRWRALPHDARDRLQARGRELFEELTRADERCAVLVRNAVRPLFGAAAA